MLKPLKDRIIVRLDVAEQKQVILTNENQVCRNRGIVQSVGPEVTSVKPGDYILFHQFDELPLPDNNLVVIRERSLLGIYNQ